MDNKRQIKFRAWIPDEDEHGKMFILPFSDGEHIEGLNENGTIEICRYNDYIVKVAGLDDENISEGFQPCEAVIMQFTGLKDKNGKEIYEGDIVRLKYYGVNDPLKNQTVIFKDGKWQTNHWRTGKYLDFDGCEIIGNEYEGITISIDAHDSIASI